jgi:hypothetical protein
MNEWNIKEYIYQTNCKIIINKLQTLLQNVGAVQ